jgi:flagellar hook-associated protein FlgK
MDVGSAVNQGLIGMQKSQSSMYQSAQQIAGMAKQGVDAPVQDLAESLVNLKVQQQVFDSSAKVVKTANDMIGSLLDVKA